MFEPEARWIAEAVATVAPGDKQLECLNLGSSTKVFREQDQPFIHRLIFAPYADRLRVTHCDMKADDGVDLVGDLADPRFLAFLASRTFDVVICTNLLMHLERPDLVFDLLDKCVRVGGHVILTNPTIYPYCGDPVDSKYRASAEQMMAALPNFKPVRWKDLEVKGRHIDYLLTHPRATAGFLANLALPKSGITKWRRTASDLPNLFKNYKVACLLMAKDA